MHAYLSLPSSLSLSPSLWVRSLIRLELCKRHDPLNVFAMHNTRDYCLKQNGSLWLRPKAEYTYGESDVISSYHIYDSCFSAML